MFNLPLKSIRTKFILTILGINILLVIPMILFIYQTNRTVSHVSLTSQLEKLQYLSQNMLKVKIKDEATIAELMLSDPTIIELLTKKETEGVKEFFQKKLTSFQYDQILLVNSSDQIINNVTSLPMPAKEIAALPFIQKSIHLKQQQTALFYHDHHLIYYTAIPLYKNNIMIAVAVLGKIVDAHFFKQLTENLNIDFTLMRGLEVITSTINTAKHADNLITKDQIRWIEEHPDKSLEFDADSAYYHSTLQFIGKDAQSVPILLLIGIEDEILYKAFDNAIIHIIFIFMFALLIIAVVITLFSYQLYTIISKIIHYTQQIKQGDYKTKIEMKTNDEFEVLADNLEEMRAAIYDQDHHLHEYTEKLESKVRERTQKLNIQYSFLKTIFDLQDEMIIVIKEGDINYANRACLNFCGFTDLDNFKEEKRLYTVFGASNFKEFQESLANGGPFPSEIDINDAHGRKVHFEVKFYPLVEEKQSYLVIFNDITLHKNEKARLYQQATTDALTGLSNRFDFKNKLQYILKQIERTKNDAVFCILDIDKFKEVNDTYGHPIGDRVLQDLATLLQNNIRGSDLLARWGGEEFVIVFYPTTQKRAETFLETLRHKISTNHVDNLPHITCSFGATVIPLNSTEEEVLKKADKALYRAKQEGRNCVRFA